MNKFKTIAFIILITFIYSCQKETLDMENIEPNTTKLSANEDVLDRDKVQQTLKGGGYDAATGEFYDGSTLIRVKIFSRKSTSLLPQQTLSVSVDPNYVLVGGGAYTSNYSTSHGAFLRESYPSANLTTWTAKSTDHLEACSHHLTVYAVGMRVVGWTAAKLKSNMVFATGQSSYAISMPVAYAKLPSNYMAIGGGARVIYQNESQCGNLLKDSYASLDKWWVRSEDHLVSSHANIMAYCIGIKKDLLLPNGGILETKWAPNSAYVSYGLCNVSAAFSPSYGYVQTCPSGKTTQNSYGRMLHSLYPNPSNNSTNIASEDLLKRDGGYTTATSICLNNTIW